MMSEWNSIFAAVGVLLSSLRSKGMNIGSGNINHSNELKFILEFQQICIKIVKLENWLGERWENHQ